MITEVKFRSNEGRLMLKFKTFPVFILTCNIYLVCVSPTEGGTRSFEYRDVLQTKASIFRAVVDSLNRALEGDISKDVVHFSIGMVYWLQGQGAEAQREVQQAIELNPNRPEYYVVQGALLAQNGDMHESQKALELAVKKPPLLVEGFNVLAFVYSKTGQLEKSTELLNKAQAFFPNEASVFFNQGINYGCLKTTIKLLTMYRLLTACFQGTRKFAFILGLCKWAKNGTLRHASLLRNY